MPEADIECGSFTSHFYWFFTCLRKQILDNCAYQIVDKRMIDCLDEIFFETDED